MENYYAIVRSGDHLAHYGVKGMKWGVRKAIATGNERALDRHFRKAARKLKKLQDIGLNPKKYAAKAAAYGSAAVGTGTIAVSGLLQRTTQAKKNSLSEMMTSKPKTVNKKRGGLSTFMDNKLGRSKNVFDLPSEITPRPKNYKGLQVNQKSAVGKAITAKMLRNVANSTPGLIGAGVATGILGAKAAQNAYRAKNASKYRQKASEFKSAMDREFSGTKYEGQYVARPKTRKKKRR